MKVTRYWLTPPDRDTMTVAEASGDGSAATEEAARNARRVTVDRWIGIP